jgi:hypothetical protein
MGIDAGYTKQMLQWQQQVLADGELTPLVIKVAVAICKFINRESRDAWPSQATLAKAVHASRRGVQKALEQLEDRSHLRISVNRGRGQSNRYRPMLAREFEAESQMAENANRSAHFGNEAEQKCEPGFAGVRTAVRTRVRTPVRTNYLKAELSEEPSDPALTGKTKERAFEKAFEKEFWPLYPKRVAKGAARKAFIRILVAERATVGELKAGAARYAAERAGKDEEFTKHPATWLNGECWKDEPNQPALGIDFTKYRRPPVVPRPDAENPLPPRRRASG